MDGRWRFKREIPAQYFERQKLPPLLSANQELRNQTHFRFSQTLSYRLLYSLTHNTILSHTHYYTLSHTLLFSLTYTTILSHIPNYTLTHTLLYSFPYPTILSHIHYYNLSHTTILSPIHYYTLSYIHVKGV